MSPMSPMSPVNPKRRVAVIGSGISGLTVARGLGATHAVTLFEAGSYFGGHTHTVDVTLDGVTHGVDTGFLVFNERTYPNLIRLFAELGIDSAKSDMSFSVQVPNEDFEWSGSSLNTVFAQRANLLRPGFWRMLADLLRFNRVTTGIARGGDESALRLTIRDWLDRERFGPEFRDGYLLPMIGCIWSCPTSQMLEFPVATLIRFCHNHGLLQVADRPQWWTVRGGARRYVDRMLESIPDARLDTPVLGVRRAATPQGEVAVRTHSGVERFDEVVLACHSDQALALLEDATPDERSILGAIGYHRNRALLHTDTALMPRRRLAWAAWNYERAAGSDREDAAVCLHYWINRLQPLPFRTDVIVSLNPVREPRAGSVLGEFDYAHPVFDLAAIDAQKRLPRIQGVAGTWFCGAWTRFGFHEDGLMSGQQVLRDLAGRQADASPARPREFEVAA
jgi:predicted NAD/FAD-binding protein